jgi:DNA-binding MarR family transcriptional regulator
VKTKVRARRARHAAQGPSVRVLPCACANLRRAARAASQIYDAELRGAGLTIAQFTLLQVLFRVGKVTQGGLAQILVLDSTTLTRTLRPLERQGWIRRRPGKDRRERQIVLTSAGRSRFQRAVPAWNRAQELLLGKVGRRRRKGLMAELSRIADSLRRTP